MNLVRGRDSSALALLLGMAAAVLAGACIPFLGDENGAETSPTPTPTIMIIRPSPTAIAEPTPPPAEGTVYVVKSGDTLSGIASQFPGVTYLDIANANDLEDPYPLQVGQQLVIPPPPNQEPTPTPAGRSVVQTPEPKD